MFESQTFERLGMMLHRVFRDATQHRSKAIVIRKTRSFYFFETDTGAVLGQLPRDLAGWDVIQKIVQKINEHLSQNRGSLPAASDPDRVAINLGTGLDYTPQFLESVLKKIAESA